VEYDEDELAVFFRKAQAARRGTEMHDLAAKLIKLNVNLPDTPTTMNMYVNDAIGFRMAPEQPLMYSRNIYGTADAISFRNMRLRIHDLKTGEGKTNGRQLKVYDAYFCLEYDVKPHEIEHILRIYQHDTIYEVEVDPHEIVRIMEKIKVFDRLIEEWKAEDAA
jgi:hypothetical protein